MFSLIKDNAKLIVTNNIQKIWSTNILASYKIIKNKYPLNQQTNQDLSLNDFIKFFALDSETNIFIDTYIAPLCKTENDKFSSLKNSIITFDKNFLDQITLYKWIQKMFFINNELMIRVNLIPKKINENINYIELTVDNQVIKLFSGKEPAVSINSPFTHEKTMSINIIDQGNHSHILSNNGPWALFKTISKSQISHSNNSNEFNLSFNIDQFQIKYKLITENIINPFIFDVFNAFKLNNKIFKG